MPKAKVSTIPNTKTLHTILEEYQETLREADRSLKKVLSLNPESEAYWDELTKLHPILTTMESSANSIQEEIENLIDQLPED